VSEATPEKKVIRLVVRVLISGPTKEESVKAKVDTGADRTTVSRELAQRLGLRPTGSKITVKLSAGHKIEKRPLVKGRITLKGRTFRLSVGVADRSQMRYPLIIGRDILRSGEFLIDPTRKPKPTGSTTTASA
jgi:hypothetical protein